MPPTNGPRSGARGELQWHSSAFSLRRVERLPGQIRGGWLRRLSRRAPRGGLWNHLAAPVGGRGEDAVVAQEMGARRRDQRGEAAQQLARLEEVGRATVAEGPLETV